jgi:hypothetical protein
MGAASIPFLRICRDAERMLALTAFLARGLFSLTLNFGAIRAFQRLVLRLHSIKERLQLGGVDGNVCHCYPSFLVVP